MADLHDDPQLAVDATRRSRREPLYTAADKNTNSNERQDTDHVLRTPTTAYGKRRISLYGLPEHVLKKAS